METISVVVPAYNEERRLGRTLSLWQEFIKAGVPGYEIAEIIVADDGSEDKTCQVAESFSGVLPIKLIRIFPNKGKGNAVRAGVKESLGDLIFTYDADAAVLPQEIKKLLAQADSADVIIGSRTIAGAQAKMSFVRRFIGMCFHLLCLPLLPGIKDASCGAKLFRKNPAKEIFSQQKIERFAFDVEILWLAKKLGFRIAEVGLLWQEIPDSKVKVFKDGLEMFFSVMGIYKRQLLG